MMPDDLEQADLPGIATRMESLAQRIRLPLSRHNWRGAAGEFQGQGVGSSLDFQDHRTYLPGDDPRHINWQAYARTGHYSMKLYREEVRPLIDLVFDGSSSMFAFPEKQSRTLELLYFLVHAILESGSSGRVYLWRGSAWKHLELEALVSHHWLQIFRSMEEDTSSMPPPLELIPFRAHSMRLLLSDLLYPGDSVPMLQALSAHHGFGAILAPYDAQEAHPGWSGNYEMWDVESGATTPRRVDRQLLNRYQDAYRQHFDHWKRSARKAGFQVARIPSAKPLVESLHDEAIREGILELAP